jgi:membrane-associated protein
MELLFGIDLASFIEAAGYIGLFTIVFAESGLFLGFFLPGDSLLFTAGFAAAAGHFSLWVLLPLLSVAAILGDSFGYWFGTRFGAWLMERGDSWWFKKRYIRETELFYQKHGSYAVVIARFVPIVRTFTPILAGMGNMRYRTFITYNCIGGVGWATGLLLFGFGFGSIIPNPDRYLLPVVLAIIFTSFLPPLLRWLRS